MTTLLKGAASPHRLNAQPTTTRPLPSTPATSTGGLAAHQQQPSAEHFNTSQAPLQQQPRMFYPRKHPKQSPQPQQQLQNYFSNKMVATKTSLSTDGASTQVGGGFQQQQTGTEVTLTDQQQLTAQQQPQAAHQQSEQPEQFAQRTFQHNASEGDLTTNAEEQNMPLARDTGYNGLNGSASGKGSGHGGGSEAMGAERGSCSSFSQQFGVGGAASDDPSPFFAGYGDDLAGVLSETNLYIRGLPEDCSDEKLREMCSPYGKIVSTKAIMDKATRKCRGYGFVDFDRSESAHAAIKGLMEQDGAIHAQMAKQQEQDPTNLYIANLPPEYDEERLSELLQTHGLVISSRILRNSDQSSRGVGFCRMTTAESCASIIAKFHGKKLTRNGQPLIVKLADSSSRKSKRSTPSLRSFYSGESSGYKTKMTATPLLHHSLMDSLTFQGIPSHHPAAVAAMAMGNGRYANQYGAPQHPYNATPIPDLLSTQFQQLVLTSNGGAGSDLVTDSQNTAQTGGVTSTDFQHQLQQQISQQQQQQTQQQQPIFYQPTPASYYQLPYYVPAAAAAAPGTAAYPQQPLFFYPQDYFTFAVQQQQQAAAAAAAATAQISATGAATLAPGLNLNGQQQQPTTMLTSPVEVGGVFYPQQQNQVQKLNPYSPGAGNGGIEFGQQQHHVVTSENSSGGAVAQGGEQQQQQPVGVGAGGGQEQQSTQQSIQYAPNQQLHLPSYPQQQQTSFWTGGKQPQTQQHQQYGTNNNNWRNPNSSGGGGTAAP